MKKIRSASLKLGKILNDELNDIINIYPVVAPQKTTYPFAVYKRLNLQVANSKDIYNHTESANVEIIIVSNTYTETVEKAVDVKMFLEHLSGTYKTAKDEYINISNITLVDSSEDWSGDAYYQVLNFQIDMDNEPDEN